MAVEPSSVMKRIRFVTQCRTVGYVVGNSRSPSPAAAGDTAREAASSAPTASEITNASHAKSSMKRPARLKSLLSSMLLSAPLR